MKKNFRVIFGLILLLITSVAGISITFEKEEEAVLGESAPVFRVDDVIDGDTIVVEAGNRVETVRLLGIDTPELKHPRKEIECFAEEASKRTTELVQAKEVILRADSTQSDKDRYGRLLRYVYLTDGTFVNKALIEEGYAYEYTYKAPYKLQAEFQAAEDFARVNELGLWGGSCLE